MSASMSFLPTPLGLFVISSSVAAENIRQKGSLGPQPFTAIYAIKRSTPPSLGMIIFAATYKGGTFIHAFAAFRTKANRCIRPSVIHVGTMSFLDNHNSLLLLHFSLNSDAEFPNAPSFSFATSFFQDLGGTRKIPSSRTKAHFSGRLFFAQKFGFE